MASDFEHLEILAGYVLDNDELITYKWLSKELQVHVNVAKEILWEFYKKYRNENNIECTYLLIGILKDNSMRVEVVRELDLSKAKEKFSRIISEHLYSVHKSLEDLKQLATSGSGDVTYSAIKCDECKKRNDEEMYLLRWGTAPKKTIGKDVDSKSVELANCSKIQNEKVIPAKNKFNNFFNIAGKQKNPETTKFVTREKDKDSTEKGKSLPNNIGLEENDKSPIKKDKSSPQKNGCSTENSKEENILEKNKISEKTKKDSMEKNKSSGEKSRTKKISPKAEDAKKTKKGGLDNFLEKMTSPLKSTENKILKKEDNKTKTEPTKNMNIKEKEKIHGKKRSRSQESNNTAKKRKRIMIQSDSSDSEMESDIEKEETMAEVEIEVPVKPKSPSPPSIKHENGKRKVLKLVNKTYKEGDYMVTKKEHVYVSCSEDEEEEKKKEPPKLMAKVENMKKKQTKLTNFFTKS